MGFRGGRAKKFNNRKKGGNNKPKNKHQKSRTYSLYSNETAKFGAKRKFVRPENDAENEEKRRKNEAVETKHIIPNVQSSESEEELDDMSQLLGTFKTESRGKTVDSSDDTDEGNNSENEEELDEDIENEDEIDEESEEEASSEEEDKEMRLSDENCQDDRLRLGTKTNEEDPKTNEPTDISEEEEEEEIELNNEEEMTESPSDPFSLHLAHELSPSLLNSVQNSPMTVNTTNLTWPKLGNLTVQIPVGKTEKNEKSLNSIAEEQIFAPVGKPPERLHLQKETFESLCIKSQIVGNLERCNEAFSSGDGRNRTVPLTTFQGEIFSVLNNYQDFYYPCRTFDNAEEIRFVYCLHAVNHILKTRTKVLHHNARLSKRDEVPEEFRDQGLVRPKILIVAPFKSSAYKIVQLLISILIAEDKGNVINKNRFVEEYTGSELVMPKKNPKPEDYELTFAGNTGDDFKIGITVTKKSLKLYAAFYSSDIIIASPLGLRTIIGADGEPDRDFDFLASIELLIFDQTEIFLMQNWDHVLHILNHVHLQPKESHGTDFSRVRHWSLNGWSKYYRQTLIFSSVTLPEINSIFNKRCFNYSGKVKVVNEVSFGSIRQVFVQLPHVFHKINVNSVEHSIDARFDFFVGKILPQQRDALMKQTLVYVSNYFDFVKLRNYFKKEDVSFVQICEYSKDAKIARARDMFFHGDAHFLLYTERHHFFNRIRVKGIRHLVFYQPPNFPNFYYEMCNFMQEANMNKKVGSMSNMTVTVLYTKYDSLQLAAVVSTEKAAKMLQSEKSVHMLVTDGE